MTSSNDQPASTDDILAAVNAGFTRMQEQMDGIQKTQAEHSKLLQDHAHVLQVHTQLLNEHSQLLEGHTGRLESIQRIQQSEIGEKDRQQQVLDSHEQRLQVLEGKPD